MREALEEEIGQQKKYAQRAQEAKEPEEEKKHEAPLAGEFEKVKVQFGDKILSDPG
jgi:biotin carboxyl carrier protein